MLVLSFKLIQFHVYGLFPERFGDGDTSQIGLDLDEVNVI